MRPAQDYEWLPAVADRIAATTSLNVATAVRVAMSIRELFEEDCLTVAHVDRNDARPQPWQHHLVRVEENEDTGTIVHLIHEDGAACRRHGHGCPLERAAQRMRHGALRGTFRVVGYNADEDSLTIEDGA